MTKRPTRYMEDHELISGCIRNNRKSQNLLFLKHADFAMGTARRYVNDGYESKDILLRSFEKVFHNISAFDANKGSFRSWLSQIISNEALNYLRSKRKFVFTDDLDALDDYFDPLLVEEIDAKRLLLAIKQLRHPFGVIFNLVIDGYKHKEIANLLGTTEATSRSYYKRARTMIQKELSHLFSITDQ